MSYTPIRDYAIIGNLRSATLVSKDGSIDWLPAPFIDSPSVFAAILDSKKGGRWSIHPAGRYTSSQRYVEGTNIVVTRFTTPEGGAELHDFVSLERERTILPPEKNARLEICRKVIGKKGVSTIVVEFSPRLNYARGRTVLTKVKHGVHFKNGRRGGSLPSRVAF
jgi:GH15 family glucan-1,4-alpha-glucosidase